MAEQTKTQTEEKVKGRIRCSVLFHYLRQCDSSAIKFLSTWISDGVSFDKDEVSIYQGLHPYGDYTRVVETDIFIADNISCQKLEIDLLATWCEWQKTFEPFGWITIKPPKSRLYLEDSISNETEIKNAKISSGSLISPTDYCPHWSSNSRSVGIYFEHDRNNLSISIKELGLKFEISCKTLTDKFIVSYTSQETTIYFETTEKLKMYTVQGETVVQRWIPDQIDVRNRIGLSTVLRLSFPSEIIKDVSNENPLLQIIARFKRKGFTVVYAHVDIKSPYCSVDELGRSIRFDHFETEYAWQCLLHRGYKVIDSITQVIRDHLIKHKSIDLSGIFYEMESKVDDNIFFEFNHNWNESLKVVETIGRSNPRTESNLFVRRIVITPTSEIYLKKEPTKQNRVIRQYDADYFIRVVFRDEDFGKLCLPSKQISNPIIDRIKDFMKKGFQIGDRNYDFLGCSNSQMREHSVWFCAPHNGKTADSIRKSLGDFSKERCVASYVSRLGLCFSASCETVEVNKAILLDDTERNGYCFTDGIGKVSRALAKRISNKLGNVDVSAFQIRYAGCKGVVAVDPNLAEEEPLVIRKSMKKFDSSSNVLEIIQWTHPGQLFLNRQIITLMSGLGVPDEAFFSLQQNMLMDLANMLINEDHALKVLRSVLKRMDVKQLKKNGINVTKEPFFRSILVTIYYEKIGGLSRKSRIEIPWSNGRIMMGTVDETGILEYGQVFIAFSGELDTTRTKTVILEETVVVAKNPCFHPGDLRKLQAVDIPELYHMVDCIVFPQNGERPHPDEMSGSDLDGDMYFVCWDRSLIPPEENRTPMDFPKSDKMRLPREITTDDVIDFLGDYIQQDRLGIIANAHVVHADLDGIECKACLELAQMHSDAVDFPKTGQVPELRKDLAVDRYPDFMMKRDKIMYTSNKVLGKLFQQCNLIEKNFRKLDVCKSITDNSRPDDRFRRRLHSVYKEQAIDTFKEYCKKVSDLMNLYGIETEAELITGMILSMKKQRGNLKNERFEISEIVQTKLARIQKDTRIEFFKEFGGEQNAKTRRPDALAKASAWYIVAYEFDIHISDYRCLSFPWVVSEFLTSVKTHDEDALASPTSFVDIGSSIERHANLTCSRRHDNFDDLITLSKKFISYLTGLGICQGGDLSLVGIVPLGLINNEHSTITLYTPKTAISSRICKMFNARNNQIVFENGKVMISTDKSLLRKTALIYKVLETNPHLIFPLLYILDRARDNNFIGSSRDNICDELTFTFLATCIIRNTTDTVPNDITQTYFSSHVSRWNQDVNLGSANVKEEAAQCVLKFFRSFINQITDRSSMVHSHCQLTEHTKNHLTSEVLTSFQELALYNSLESMDDTDLIEETITVPYDTWESILFAEAYIAQRISEETKASYVHIRRTYNGLILDLCGSYDQLKQIGRLIGNLAQHSSNLISTPRRDMVLIKNSCIYIFQGCTEEEDKLKFETYLGPCNKHHDRYSRNIPILHLNQVNEKSHLSRELFISKSLKQINIVTEDFIPLFHGEISLRITLGTFYVINAPGEILCITDFSNRLMMQQENNVRSKKISRGENRKLQAQKKTMMKKSFMPINCNISMFSELLLQDGFELLHESKSYQATLHLDKSIFGKRQQANISLDENMNFKHLRLDGLTWLVADVIRQKRRSGSSADIRFKITSFRTLSKKSIADMDDVKLLLYPDTCVMKETESNGIEIGELFRKRIPYVREKRVKSFHLPNPKSTLLKGLEILLSSNVEYTEPDPTGKHFQNKVTRNEISIIPKLPPPLSNQDEWSSFLEYMLDFSENIAKIVSDHPEK